MPYSLQRIGEAESAKKEDKLDIDFLSSIEVSTQSIHFLLLVYFINMNFSYCDCLFRDCP